MKKALLRLFVASVLASTVWQTPAQSPQGPGTGQGGGGPGGFGGPGGGPGGPAGFGMGGMPQLSPDQQAALRSLNQSTAPLEQAVTDSRNALNAAIYRETPDPAEIKAKVETLAAAELARALARSEAFAKLQASPNKLTLPPQQLLMLMNMNMRGGRGGPGMAPDGFGGPGGAPGRPGGPGGPNQPPPIKGGFQWID